ncbi:hypothetical protein RUM43_006926 [Polyplax serrata]|uniref:Amine oxidase domain-containing protein n=1 Tax=Polyplax serrata TaxID=468196 RepID=A0AAN8S8G3_POLSC
MAEAAEWTDKNFTKIIIIGAGIGGISAADALTKNGITDFKILEAGSKIGGRIEAIEAGKLKLEMGANYIHGILGNPMYELALSHGLIDITHSPKPHNVVAAMEDGSQVPFSILQEIYEAYICFLKRCEEYFTSDFLPPDGITSVGDHIKLEAELYLDKMTNSNEKHLKQLIFDCLLKRETCITGCDDMGDVDLLELGSYTELQGGNILVSGGYSSILNAVAQDIPPENIVLNHVVSDVKWASADSNGDYFYGSGYDSGIDLLANSDVNNDSDSDKTVTGGTPTPRRRSSTSNRCSVERIINEDDKLETFNKSVSEKLCDITEEKESSLCEVVCENGAKFFAHHVICTIPLGVLKEKATTLFSPKLPQDKLDSINKLSFGTVDKIYLEYPRPFLHGNVSEVMLLWEAEPEDTPLESSWFKKIYAFSKVTETLILGWISGKEARYMETLPEQVVGEKCTQILRKFLNDPYIPLPKSCLSSKWYSRQHFKGSYTSIAVGASQMDVRRVAQPLCAHSQQKKPVLLFAGEHTHSSFYSTVHGAYLSGKIAAHILLSGDELNEFKEEDEEEEDDDDEGDEVTDDEK